MQDKSLVMKVYDVIVVGGGAAGMMAAGEAARAGAQVLLIEKNKRLGEKLRITGGGRCNITNYEENTRLLLKNYGKAEQFLYSAFTKFGVQDTVEYFDNLRLPIRVEANKRAFPVSQKAGDVVAVLERQLRHLGVTVKTGNAVTQILTAEGKITGVVAGDVCYQARSYIISSGGTSRPETGSTGDGFGWLADLGHDVSQPSPTITPLAVRDSWVASVAGVPLNGVGISFAVDGERSFKLKGTILLTHFGISGPLILNNAYRVAELLETGTVTAQIDCFPELDEKALDQHIIAQLMEHGSKQLKNTLRYIVPAGMTPAFKELLPTIDFDIKTADVNRELRKQLVDILKHLPLTIDHLMGFEKAVVADGGVSLTEIDMRTMRSKKIANLFVIGDLLNINRPSGGYSLQLCWTTGFIAGQEAASYSIS